MQNYRIRILSLINKIIPKNARKIGIYGRSMLNENTKAILDYLVSNKFNDKYKIDIYVRKGIIGTSYDNIPNVKLISNPFLTLLGVLRSKYIFHSHGMTVSSVIPCRGQIIFDLWHGSPLKLIGVLAGDKWFPETDSYFLCASPFMAEVNKKCFLLKDEQIFIGSNPRNDLLFTASNNNEYIKSLKGKRKLIIYMPTFRNSKTLGKNDSTEDFPLLTLDNVYDFDKFLNDNDVLLLIKPHPYQNDIPLFEKEYKSIVVLKNSDLNQINLPLYELLGQSDALISDFSSVYFDYMLLDKPIGFAIDDISEYGTSRGFTVDNPLDIMPGPKIDDMEGLKSFIKDVIDGKDTYCEQRHKINDLCNTFKTPDACKRILDFLKINK